MSERPIEELLAGNRFRDSMTDRADGLLHGGPGWCGWVIMDAFLAGIDFERKKHEMKEVRLDEARCFLSKICETESIDAELADAIFDWFQEQKNDPS